MARRKPYVRCIAKCRDGSPCGRMAPADTQICSVHSETLKSPIIPSEVDELVILKKLARSSNEQIKLRAVDLLLSLRAKTTPLPATPSQAGFLADCTPEERAELIALIDRFKAIREQVYTRRPELRPEGSAPPVTVIPAPYQPPDPALPDPTESNPEPEMVTVYTSTGRHRMRRDELRDEDEVR